MWSDSFRFFKLVWVGVGFLDVVCSSYCVHVRYCKVLAWTNRSMRKTVIGPDVGSDLELFDGVEGVDELPHSEAVAVDLPEYRRVFISGTAAIDAEGVVAPGDAAEQMRAILRTIADILALVDGGMRDVVRMKLVTEELSEEEYLDVCRIRESFLPEGHDPASTMIESDDVGLEGMRLEADADAIVPKEEWELDHARRE